MPGITVQGTFYETELVIFDKDGTLLDFGKSWVGIIREFIDALNKHTTVTKSLKSRIEQALGIFVDEGRVDGNGALAMGTFSECNALLTYSLYREGVRWDEAQGIVTDVGRQIFSPDSRAKHVCAAEGAIDLLKTLKARGIPVAVATNDKEYDATVDMELIGAKPYIDLVVGADSVEHSKPASDMVELICSRLCRNASRTILIGDTVMDAMLGKNSNVMLTIGVSGIVQAGELAEHMNLTVPSLKEIV